MKNLILVLGIAIGVSACQKEETTEPKNAATAAESLATFSTTGQTLVVMGDFENAVHPTSGKAKIYEDKDKKRSLVFEGFKTDAGPDLRIYLAEDKSVTNFVEITDVVKNGNGVYVLPNTVDLKKQKFILIWCKKFGVLFGSAQLK